MSARVAELTERQRETEADKRLYIEIGLVPVTCRACGVEVAVKKNSQRHTSVQWSAEAVAGCQEFAALDPAVTPFKLGCGKLKSSIDAAVEEGLVVVPDA